MSRTSNSPTTATRSAARSAAQSSATSCSSSGRGRHGTCAASNEYMFTRSETDTIEQKQTFNSAFGKVNYDPTNRLRTSFSVLWTPTTSEGTLAAYDGSLRELDLQPKASNQIQKTRGLRDSADQLRGHARLHAEQLVAHQRARRLCSTTTTRTPACRRSAACSSPDERRRPWLSHCRRSAGRRRVPEHSARSALRVRPHQAWICAGRLHQGVHDGRLAQSQGRRRLPAHGQRRRRSPIPAAGTCGCTGTASFTSNDTGRTDRGPYGYYEVDDRGVAGQGIGGHLVALCAGPVDDPQPHAQPRSPHGARGHPVVPHRRPGRRVQVRVRRQARPADRRQLRRVRRWPA